MTEVVIDQNFQLRTEVMNAVVAVGEQMRRLKLKFKPHSLAVNPKGLEQVLGLWWELLIERGYKITPLGFTEAPYKGDIVIKVMVMLEAPDVMLVSGNA